MTSCSVEGCARPHVARGYCHMHYLRWRKYADPSIVARNRYSVARWFCVCDEPVTNSLGECQSCFRKPRALMSIP